MLHVPEEAIQEVVVGRVYTTMLKFRHLIPQNECLVTPLVEYLPKSLGDYPSYRKDKFIVRLPHSIRDIKQVQDTL